MRVGDFAFIISEGRERKIPFSNFTRVVVDSTSRPNLDTVTLKFVNLREACARVVVTITAPDFSTEKFTYTLARRACYKQRVFISHLFQVEAVYTPIECGTSNPYDFGYGSAASPLGSQSSAVTTMNPENLPKNSAASTKITFRLRYE